MPILLAHSGPLQGRSYTVPEGEFTIGRSCKSHLWLDDPEVSRHHCVVTTRGAVSEIRDLESRNKTLVNGKTIQSVKLQNADEITIGCSVFRYSAAHDPNGDGLGDITVLSPSDSHFLSASPDPAASASRQRDLKTLLRLSNILQSLRDIGGAGPGEYDAGMRGKLEALLQDIVPASRIAVVSSDADIEAVRQARSRRVALLMPNPQGRGMLLAAPIVVRSDVPAVIYLESMDADGAFDEGHLQFVAAVAEIAAIAWENASLVGWLGQENERLERALGIDTGMVGASRQHRDLEQQIARVAATDATVLIGGETGAGKELVAHAIHRHSRRAGGPFVAINCASLAEALLESELFGHERGAFTGAIARKRGHLEMADRGTIFLDEVGDLALPLQAKLLRVLETRVMQRVGGAETIRLDLRIVAATNRNLEEAVRQGAFRQDLYFRLKVVTLRAPALRERPEDIPLLAEHFARTFAQRSGRKVIGFSREALACLQAYSWPGNVRELKHAIESAVILGSGELILAEDLPDQIVAARPGSPSRTGSYAQALEGAKREAILQALAQSNYVHDEAAKLLGLHPNYLHKLMRTLELRTKKKERQS